MDMGMVLLMSWRIFDKSADLFATKPARGTCTLLLMVQSAMALQCHSCLQSIALKVKNRGLYRTESNDKPCGQQRQNNTDDFIPGCQSMLAGKFAARFVQHYYEQ